MTDAAEVSELLTRLQGKDRAALNRLVSLASRGEAVDQIRVELAGVVSSVDTKGRSAWEGEAPAEPRTPFGVGSAYPEGAHSPSRKSSPSQEQVNVQRGRVVAVTGNSGVGKSSLITQLIDVIRGRGETVAILACDPESAITGGALLGDRVRMSAHAADEGVWIRSLASMSGGQGLADHLDLAALLLSRFGFDHVLLETVGAGQGDVAVRAVADVVVLLMQPEIGDELQWEKAGVLEVADVVVVHKGDLPGAEQTELQVREQLNLPGGPTTPVMRVSSKANAGIAELWSVIEGCAGRETSGKRNARSLLRVAQKRLADRFADRPEAVQAIVQKWAHGRLTDVDAADQVLTWLITPDVP